MQQSSLPPPAGGSTSTRAPMNNAQRRMAARLRAEGRRSVIPTGTGQALTGVDGAAPRFAAGSSTAHHNIANNNNNNKNNNSNHNSNSSTAVTVTTSAANSALPVASLSSPLAEAGNGGVAVRFPLTPTVSRAPGYPPPPPQSSSNNNHTDSVVEDRLAAFAPLPLPCLSNQTDTALTRLVESIIASGQPGLEEDQEDAPWVRALVEKRTLTNPITHIVLFTYAYLEYAVDMVEPCAKLECWEDPQTIQGGDYRGVISNLLLQQYGQILRRSGRERIFCSMCFSDLDSSRQLLQHARNERSRMDGRLLVHYNGHGLPPATRHGEVWMLDKEHKNFVSFSLLEVAPSLDGPTLFVLDVNSAGSVLDAWFKNHMEIKRPNIFFLCACSDGELLPQQPAMPADLLTACLTTPLRMAIEWYLYCSPHTLLLPNVSVDDVRALSTATDTPMYKELYVVLNAVLDTVAWCTLPKKVFGALFRHDRTTKTLFRHFVLASYIGHGAGCHPVSHPPFATDVLTQHSMWDCWEYTLERALSQLPLLISADSRSVGWERYEHYTFFDEQLTAFKLWVDRGDPSGAPDMLPCVLQALGQRTYELRALALLIRYMDVSPSAATAAIQCGIVPYLSRLYERDARLLLLVLILWMQCVRSDSEETGKEITSTRSIDWIVSALRLRPEGIQLLYMDPDKEEDSHATANLGRLNRPTASASASSPPPGPSRFTRPSLAGVGSSSSLNRSLPREKEVGGGGDEPLQPVSAKTKTAATGMPASNDRRQARRNELLLLMGMDLNRCKALVCYALSKLLSLDRAQCVMCWNARLLEAIYPCLSSPDSELCSWGCLVVASLCCSLQRAKTFTSQHFSTRLTHITGLLHHTSPVVRSSCVTLLGNLIGVRFDVHFLDDAERTTRQLQMEKKILIQLRQCLLDASLSVRREIIFFAAQVLFLYYSAVEGKPLSDIEPFVLPPIQRETPPPSAAAEGGHATRDSAPPRPPKQPTQPTIDNSARWYLEEPALRVKSSLHAAKPTDNARFDEPISLPIEPICDDDAVPTSSLRLDHLDTASLNLVRGLVHDSAKILRTIYLYGDVTLVMQQIRILAAGEPPRSTRLADEAARTMSRVQVNVAESLSSSSGGGGVDALTHQTEADRTRTRWNYDAMKQVVMDMEDRRLEMPGTSWTHTAGSSLLTTGQAGLRGNVSLTNTSAAATSAGLRLSSSLSSPHPYTAARLHTGSEPHGLATPLPLNASGHFLRGAIASTGSISSPAVLPSPLKNNTGDCSDSGSPANGAPPPPPDHPTKPQMGGDASVDPTRPQPHQSSPSYSAESPPSITISSPNAHSATTAVISDRLSGAFEQVNSPNNGSTGSGDGAILLGSPTAAVSPVTTSTTTAIITTAIGTSPTSGASPAAPRNEVTTPNELPQRPNHTDSFSLLARTTTTQKSSMTSFRSMESDGTSHIAPPPGAGSSVSTVAGAGVPAGGAASSSSTASIACYHLISSGINREDPIVAATFRVLEPHMVVATKGQMLYTIGYESYNTQEIIARHPLRLQSAIRDLHVINDLSERCGLLAVTKNGSFTILKGAFDGGHSEDQLKEVGTFCACPHRRSRGNGGSSNMPLHSAYVSNTGTLYYGGSMGEEGRVEIHALSLSEEQVVQELRVVVKAALTALQMNPAGKALYAGFDDGVVRYYDDRQGSGQIGAVAEGRCSPPSSKRGAANSMTSLSSGVQRSGGPAPVVGVGPVATGHGHTVVAATSEDCCVFDTRKWREPVSCYSHSALYYGAAALAASGAGPQAYYTLSTNTREALDYDATDFTDTSPLDAGASGFFAHSSAERFGMRVQPAPLLARCSVSPYTGLIGLCFEDARYGAFNVKGQLLCDRLQTVVGRRAYSDTCITHPLRPFMAMAGDLLFL